MNDGHEARHNLEEIINLYPLEHKNNRHEIFAARSIGQYELQVSNRTSKWRTGAPALPNSTQIIILPKCLWRVDERLCTLQK